MIRLTSASIWQSGEASACRLKACGDANPLVGGALGKRSLAAVVAIAAWDVVKDHDPVADGKLGYAFADGSDCPGCLVAEDAWRGV